MKGQSILISHAILVGFSIFLVYAVSTTFVSLRSDYQEFIGPNEVSQVCFVMNGAIEKIYTEPDYNYTTDTLVGRIDVRLPNRIADVNYRAIFVNRSLNLEAVDETYNSTCTVGFDSYYNGSTNGGLTRITYTRHVNGTSTIEMLKI